MAVTEPSEPSTAVVVDEVVKELAWGRSPSAADAEEGVEADKRAPLRDKDSAWIWANRSSLSLLNVRAVKIHTLYNKSRQNRDRVACLGVRRWGLTLSIQLYSQCLFKPSRIMILTYYGLFVDTLILNITTHVDSMREE